MSIEYGIVILWAGWMLGMWTASKVDGKWDDEKPRYQRERPKAPPMPPAFKDGGTSVDPEAESLKEKYRAYPERWREIFGYQPICEGERPKTPPDGVYTGPKEKVLMDKDGIYRKVMGDDIPDFLKRQAE